MHRYANAIRAAHLHFVVLHEQQFQLAQGTCITAAAVGWAAMMKGSADAICAAHLHFVVLQNNKSSSHKAPALQQQQQQ
jgi:protocatechuate 3,4-dioxygenase beta subunit